MTRPDAPLIWVNAAFRELTGYSDHQVSGRNCRPLRGPATDRRTIAELGAAVAAGRQVRTRLLNYRADGVPWWNELQLSPVRDTRGALTHYVGVQHDITARVEAEAKVLHLAYHDAPTGLHGQHSVPTTPAQRDNRCRARSTPINLGEGAN